MRPAITLALVCATVFAQPTGTGVIAGTVVDDASGEPVRKAIVTVTWHGTPRSWATARTDASGKFRFDGLPAGSYDLRANKNGGVAIYGANNSRESGENVVLNAGETRENLKLRFIHYATISGHVYDSTGAPTANATVSLLRVSRNFGQPVLMNAAMANTNDRGEYHIPQAPPGRYYLYASSNNALLVRPVPRATPDGPPDHPDVLAGQFYGGATDSKDAAQLSVKDSDVLRGMDFTLTTTPAVHITGHLTGVPQSQTPEPAADGPAVARGIVRASQFIQLLIQPISDIPNRYGLGATATPPEYSFVSDWLIPGRYRVFAHYSADDKAYAASQIVDVSSDSTDVELALAPAFEVHGHLRVEGPIDPKTKFAVNLNQPGGQRFVINGSLPGPARVAPDGSFTIPGIFPGEWNLNLTPLAGSTFFKSVHYGDQDALLKPIDIKSAAALDIVISTRSAKIHGDIDAQGSDPARAAVLLAPVGEFHEYARFYYSVLADEHGAFHRTGIAPGKYKVYAVEKLAPEGFRNPEAFDQVSSLFADFLQEIELKEDSDVEFHPKLIPMERARDILP